MNLANSENGLSKADARQEGALRRQNHLDEELFSQLSENPPGPFAQFGKSGQRGKDIGERRQEKMATTQPGDHFSI